MRNLKALGAEITRHTLFGMQVCVPADATDEEITTFGNQENPSGTRAGWVLAEEGDAILGGDPPVVNCAERPGFVHRVFQC